MVFVISITTRLTIKHIARLKNPFFISYLFSHPMNGLRTLPLSQYITKVLFPQQLIPGAFPILLHSNRQKILPDIAEIKNNTGFSNVTYAKDIDCSPKYL